MQMSGVTKPMLTVAQLKAMMGRVPPQGIFFSLANVRKIIGPLKEGSLSSKLSSLSNIPSDDIPGKRDETDVSYSKTMLT